MEAVASLSRPRVRLFIIRATDRQCFLVVSLTLLLMFRSAGSGGVTYPRDWPCVILSVGNGRFNQPRSTVYIYTTTTLFRYWTRCVQTPFFLSVGAGSVEEMTFVCDVGLPFTALQPQGKATTTAVHSRLERIPCRFVISVLFFFFAQAQLLCK